MPVILGIDPGSRITGYGVIESNGQKHQYLACGAIRTQSEYFPKRLQQIFQGISQIAAQYQIQEAAIEQVFIHANASSALKLGQARGAAITALMQQNLEVFEYAPKLIKQAVVGTGSADKNQVQQMIKILLKLNAAPKNDAADALAIAICHANSRSIRFKMRVKK